MSRVCSVCGKGSMSGNRVSHSNRKARRIWGANVHKTTITSESGSVVKEYLCTRCLRTQKKVNK